MLYDNYVKEMNFEAAFSEYLHQWGFEGKASRWPCFKSQKVTWKEIPCEVLEHLVRAIE